MVLILNQTTDFVGTLERRFYDFSSTATSRQPSDRIAIIAIDNQSVENIGRWPWQRDVHAKLIDKLAEAKAKTIVYTTFFSEPQVDAGLPYIRKMRDLLATSDPAIGINTQLSQLIVESENALDTDAALAASIKKAGNVLLPSFYVTGEQQGRPDIALPDFVTKNAIEDKNGLSMSAIRGQQPIQILGEAAAGVGHLVQAQDPIDGVVRYEPLMVNWKAQGGSESR